MRNGHVKEKGGYFLPDFNLGDGGGGKTNPLAPWNQTNGDSEHQCAHNNELLEPKVV